MPSRLSLVSSTDYAYNVEKLLSRLIRENKRVRLVDVTPAAFQAWRRHQSKAPKTLNEYLDTRRGLLN